jgi:hypothetical protein
VRSHRNGLSPTATSHIESLREFVHCATKMWGATMLGATTLKGSMLGTFTRRHGLPAWRRVARWQHGAIEAALAISIAGGCSSDKPEPTAPTSTTSDATNTSPVPTSSRGASEPEPSNGASTIASAPDDSAVTTTTPSALIEPGVPVALASEVVFGARLCSSPNGRLFYPNRIGYPNNPGLEELWTVSRSGGDARSFAAPGSVTGCALVSNELWVARYDTAMLTRLDVESGTQLGTFPTSGTPLQVASNSSHVFASIYNPTPSGDVVRIDPKSLSEPEVLWSKPGRVTALWLRADDQALLFSARDPEADTSWIVSVQLSSPRTTTEIVTTTGELGAVASAGGSVFYAHHAKGELHAVDTQSRADTVLTTVPGIWSLWVDGDHVYFTTRPDYCSNNEGKLYRIPVAGGEPTLLTANLNCPSQLLGDDDGLYWINTGSWQGPDSGESAPADGSVMHLPRR